MKTLKRILSALLLATVAVVVVIGLSIPLDGLLSGGNIDPIVNTRIVNPNGPDVRAYVARPTTPGPHPTVIMIHEFWGLTAEINGKADALAEEGYIVVAPHLFRDSAASWVPRAIYQVATTPQDQINSDLDAVYAWMKTQPDIDIDRVAIMGFCFGGGTALRYSLHNSGLASTIILYGSLITDPDQLKALPGPVLGIFGGNDQSIPLEDVQAFEAALNELGVPNKISIFEGQPHAFVKSIEEIRQGGPQGQAWDEVRAFLKETLQTPNSGQRKVSPITVISTPDWQYALRLAYEHAFGTAAHGNH